MFHYWTAPPEASYVHTVCRLWYCFLLLPFGFAWSYSHLQISLFSLHRVRLHVHMRVMAVWDVYKFLLP